MGTVRVRSEVGLNEVSSNLEILGFWDSGIPGGVGGGELLQLMARVGLGEP